MKILVFDDNRTHRAAAEAQLAEHELTIVGSYDEALSALLPKVDYEKEKAILQAQFGDFSPYRAGIDEAEKKAAYFAAAEKAREQATTYPAFDVVLTDLLVPATKRMQGTTEHVGKEMANGIFVGLIAAVRARVKRIAVFTDSDHHSHPASACFDDFNKSEQNPTPFRVEESLVLLCNNRNWVGEFDPGDLATQLEYEQYRDRTDTVRAKNWAALLAYLLSHTPS